ncbi:MAG: D-tyrosyl-tRNA(Tyr) deacylase [Bacteroidales bacterium]|nr:D-tyrosyl-tRNA(Tyr) deacylase [Bacteroidales bacterium]
MRALIQRVSQAQVIIDGDEKRNIANGLLIFLGIEEADTAEDIKWLSAKISKLRIFDDIEGVMNNSILDINGEAMVISQFTLYAKTKKGNRPSYIRSADPKISEPLYLDFVKQFSIDISKYVVTGDFGAHMDITLNNSGPVTIWIDTKNKE